MLRPVLIASLLTLSASLAVADQAPVIHGVDAKCILSRVKGEPMRCASKLVIMTLPDAGRTIFLMTLARAHGGSVTLSFIGGRDTQPKLGDYKLFVDKVRIGAGGKAVNYEASGSCKEVMNDKGSFSHGTRCIAKAKDGSVFELALGPGAVQ